MTLYRNGKIDNELVHVKRRGYELLAADHLVPLERGAAEVTGSMGNLRKPRISLPVAQQLAPG